MHIDSRFFWNELLILCGTISGELNRPCCLRRLMSLLQECQSDNVPNREMAAIGEPD